MCIYVKYNLKEEKNILIHIIGNGRLSKSFENQENIYKNIMKDEVTMEYKRTFGKIQRISVYSEK